MLGEDATHPRTRARLDFLWLLDHLFGEQRWTAAQRKTLLDRMRAELERAGEGEQHQVPEVQGALHPADFSRHHLTPHLPVVMRGAAKAWPCMGTWTPTYFADLYGEVEVGLINVSIEEAEEMDTHIPRVDTVSLQEVVDSIRDGSMRYARFIPLLHHHPHLQADLDLGWLRRMRGRGVVGTNFQLFLGGAGTSTATHSALGSNLFVQIYGRKTWWIAPTTFSHLFQPPMRRQPFFFSDVNLRDVDLERRPLLRYASVYTVTLAPGDVLYNPPFFWHQVSNPTASIGLGFRWYDPRRMVSASPIQTVLTLLSTNPSVFTAGPKRQQFIDIFTHPNRSR